MRQFFSVLFIVFALTSFKSQTHLPAEKMAAQLDSIVRADQIKSIGIYVNKAYKDNIIEHIISSSQVFTFNGQFLVFTGPDHIQQYFNLNKLIYFTVNKKSRQINIFFEVF